MINFFDWLKPGDTITADMLNRIYDAVRMGNFHTATPPLFISWGETGFHHYLDLSTSNNTTLGGTTTPGPHWTFSGGVPGTSQVTMAQSATDSFPTSEGTQNFGNSAPRPLTINFNFGSFVFPSTSAANTAPAAVLVIPTLTATQPAKPTWTDTAGALICAGNFIYQFTTTTVTVPYVPTKYTDITALTLVTNTRVPIYNPVNLQFEMPNLIQADLTDLTIGINIAPTATTTLGITSPGATTTQVGITLVTNQTADPFWIHAPGGTNLLEMITTNGTQLYIGINQNAATTTVFGITALSASATTFGIVTANNPSQPGFNLSITGTPTANVFIIASGATPEVYVDQHYKLFLTASTTAGASLSIPSGTAPTTPVSGDLWFDGTHVYFYDGTTTRDLLNPSPAGYDKCLLTSKTSVTLANTVTETSLCGTLYGSKSVTANTIVAGTTFRVTAGGGAIVTTGTPTLTINFKLGANLFATVAITSTNLVSSPWEADILVTCQTTGVSATCKAIGFFRILQGQGGTSVNTWAFSTSGTFDTTVTADTDLTATWSVANPSDTITCDVLAIEQVR